MKKELKRESVFIYIVLLIFSFIVLKLLYLQIIKGDDYRIISESKAEKEIMEIAPRGEILDKNGTKIATNVLSFNIIYSNYGIKLKDTDINYSLYNTLKILNKYKEQNKLNIQLLPINFNTATSTFSYNFNTTSKDIAKKRAKLFWKGNNIDGSPNAFQSMCKLAEKYGLINENQNTLVQNKLNAPIEQLYKVIALRYAIQGVAYKQYENVYIAKNVSKSTAFEVQYKSENLRGISCEVSPLRSYPYGEVGSAFIGYLGKISEDDEYYKNLGYDVNRELVGKDRLEKVLENNADLNIHLRGEPGIKYVKIDRFGKVVKEVAKLDPIPGDTVVTTIDMKLQKVAEQALDDTMKKIRDGSLGEVHPYATRGAVVALDVNTGEVLALASRPGFNPNYFAVDGSIKDPVIAKNYFLPGIVDPYDTVPKPLYNYALSGKVQPGSTFKPLTSIAALQEGVIDVNTPVNCHGPYTAVKGFHGACWIWNEHRGSHGNITLTRALAVSCNSYFFDLGRRLGYQKLSDWAFKFGLANDPKTNEKPSTGIEITERTGSVGSALSYKSKHIDSLMKRISDKLKNPEYGPYSIDKGTEEYNAIEDMLMEGKYDETTLNSLFITNKKAQKYIKTKLKDFDTESSRPGDPLNTAIGQGNTSLTPLQMASYISTLVNGGKRYKAHLVKKVLNPDGSVKREFYPEVLNTIKLDPKNVEYIKIGMNKVTEEGGTGSKYFQNFPISIGGKTGSATFDVNQAQKKRDAYGWFLCFAPYDKPQIAVAAVIYDAGHGSYSGRVVREMLNEYFKKSITSNKKK